MVHSNIKYREDNKVYRPDMINLLMEARKGTLEHTDDTDGDVGFATVHESDVGKGKKLQKWEDDDVTAQCVLFFLAGFAAISAAQCFMSHELAVNPDIQAKLYKEISDVNKLLGDKKISYEVLQKMTYMDMVVSETLRKYALSPAGDRAVSKPYVLENDKGKRIQLNVGDGIWIPTAGLHSDPKYFPNPSKFDPERFSEENKYKIITGTYMPFGLGPRNCIGSRFALMEMKTLFYYMLKDFVIERCEKTQEPLKLKVRSTSVEARMDFGFNYENEISNLFFELNI